MVAAVLAANFPGVSDLLHDAKEHITAFADFPQCPVAQGLVHQPVRAPQSRGQAPNRPYLSEESMALLDQPMIHTGQAATDITATNNQPQSWITPPVRAVDIGVIGRDPVGQR